MGLRQLLLTPPGRVAISRSLIVWRKSPREGTMKRSASLLLLALCFALAPAGCVTRRFVITSNPPGAVVFRDGQPIGLTPVEQPFIYYGRYRFRLVKDGFEPL